jgi:type I restriction enzyme, S subunit
VEEILIRSQIFYQQDFNGIKIEMSELLDLRNIDRSSWSKFRFDQIANSISERVEPKDTNLDIYVGLEHLDPRTIHIRRTGKPSDVEGTKLKFYKGDVIFGRRRAYQRKAALADFNGICSAHSLVLRANPEVIDPNLFPFFLHSDLFMHRAIDISVGSLSPTINWGTLKNQEFLLPPKDQQAKLAELLWAGDDVIEANYKMAEKIHQVKLSFRFTHFQNFHGQFLKAGKVLKLTAGGTPSTRVNEYWENGTIRWMSSGDVHQKRIFDVEGRITELGLRNSSAKLLPINSVVIALAGQGKTKGTVAITKTELCSNQSVAAFLPNTKTVYPEFLFHYLDSIYNKFREMTGDKNSRTGLNLEILKNILIPDISIEDQKNIACEIESIDQLYISILGSINKSRLILKHITNQIFS